MFQCQIVGKLVHVWLIWNLKCTVQLAEVPRNGEKQNCSVYVNIDTCISMKHVEILLQQKGLIIYLFLFLINCFNLAHFTST